MPTWELLFTILKLHLPAKQEEAMEERESVSVGNASFPTYSVYTNTHLRRGHYGKIPLPDAKKIYTYLSTSCPFSPRNYPVPHCRRRDEGDSRLKSTGF